MVRRLLAAAALVALAGCLKPWVNSTRDDAATLTFVSEVKAARVLPYVFEDGRRCRGQRDVELDGGRAVLRIPPGDEYTVLADFLSGARRCRMAASFRPAPRAAYVAVLGWRSDRCELGIARAEGAQLVPEPTARRRISLVPGSADGFQNPCSDPAVEVDPAAHDKEGGNSKTEE